MGKAGIVGLICCCFSLILTVVSTALPYWYQYTERDTEFFFVVSSGLWMFCSKRYKEVEANCREITDVPEYFLAVRALVLMGLFIVAIANILGFVGIFVTRQRKNIFLTAGVISISAGICMLTGAFVFVGRTNYLAHGEFVQYLAGFPLTLVAGVAGIIAGILFICARPSEEHQSSSPLLH
ncbi:hypothetical protein ACJMK2_003868 [Sinanodonta woodiana]|uniref:Claudin n=1 Tax=Sinanodonta woodiana TaxID=1069815 RepID=A0ABD3Y2G4_SINWO